MFLKYKYELVCYGDTPSFGKSNVIILSNPVSNGDKVKSAELGTELREVVSIEHYPTISILYTKQLHLKG